MMPDMQIEFMDPPPDGRTKAVRRTPLGDFVAALSERPGEWALYPIPSTGGGMQHAKAAYPECEWTTRSRPDGRKDMYARYVGIE